jgi:ProP effector
MPDRLVPVVAELRCLKEDRRLNNKPNLARDTIAALSELYPQCFSLYQAKRRPLKVAIHRDLLATGAITPKECAAALRVYCGNHLYLKACTKVGAVCIGLDGEVAGRITVEEATHAKQRLDQQRAKWKRRQEALTEAKAKAEAKTRNAGRISLADLRAAAKARRAIAA